MAQLCTLLHNIVKSIWSKDKSPGKLKDFMIDWEENTRNMLYGPKIPEPQTLDEMKSAILNIAKMCGTKKRVRKGI